MGMGLNIEVTEAEPWPPEGPPIGVIPEWLKKNWPYLATIGCFGVISTIFLSLATKKK